MSRKKKDLRAFNYCVSFVDLLGQRKALEGQGFLPIFKSDQEKKDFNKVIRNAIGSIYNLQSDVQRMLRPFLRLRKNSPIRKSLPPELQAEWDEMQKTRITTQRWSDGLVNYVNLGDREVKCPMNAVFGIFAFTGGLCLLGLTRRHPIRGSIDIGWGVELHKGELYGAAIARAYELESEYANYPRIVISQRIVDYLRLQIKNTSDKLPTQLNSSLAGLCLNMMAMDADGMLTLHYLGDAFRNLLPNNQYSILYKHALDFVTEQAQHFREAKNSKLAFRYNRLEQYFKAHPPREGKSSGT
jgi:hypothetical protein